MTKGLDAVSGAFAVGEVVVSQQDLCGVQAMTGEGGFIDFNQAGLPDGCRRLLFVDGFGAASPAQALYATGDGAGRNHDDFLAARTQGARSC